MEYFFYCRDRPGSMALREELIEEHRSFMDRYADAMIARGPTLTADASAATGSVHIVDLPDADAAHVFAFEEPNYRAGVYDEVLVRRWRNLLGRTMWDFAGEADGDHRFLILGHGKPGMTAARDELRDEYLPLPGRRRLWRPAHRLRAAAIGRRIRMGGHRDAGRAARPRAPPRPSWPTIHTPGPAGTTASKSTAGSSAAGRRTSFGTRADRCGTSS